MESRTGSRVPFSSVSLLLDPDLFGYLTPLCPGLYIVIAVCFWFYPGGLQRLFLVSLFLMSGRLQDLPSPRLLPRVPQQVHRNSASHAPPARCDHRTLLSLHLPRTLTVHLEPSLRVRHIIAFRLTFRNTHL